MAGREKRVQSRSKSGIRLKAVMETDVAKVVDAQRVTTERPGPSASYLALLEMLRDDVDG